MYGVFTARLLWNPWVRILSYWLIVTTVTSLLYQAYAPLAAGDVAEILTVSFHGDLSRVSTQSFAFALAIAIFAAAAGLFVAHIVLHAILVPLAIRGARNVIRRTGSKSDFVDRFDEIHRRMGRHPLLGHAWTEFEETLVRGDGAIRNTLRPQSFFAYTTLKEKLAGLKIMPGTPGYFVGIGLLLTFIGLVIALSKAAAGTEAALAATGGAGAQAMQGPLRELLQAATFKFSTSIAGLAASIFLSFFFRLFVIRIEASLGAFCEAVEEKLDYVAPQSVTLNMVEKLEAQLTELKAINGEQFFSRMGEQLVPSMHAALHGAINPLTERIGDAVGQLTSNSQSGVEELLRRFTESVQGGAGTEMRELGTSLHAMHGVMERVRTDMSGSGEDFARRMTEAAENLNRLVADAGRNLGVQTENSRETLELMLTSLREVFDQANRKIEDNLAGAAEGASARLEQAMERVLGQLEGQVSGLRDSFGGFRESAAGYVEETRKQIAEAQAQSVEGISSASVRAAAALEEGLAKAMKVIHTEVEGFSSALRTSSMALGVQTQAIDQIAMRSREAAEVFGRSAEAIRGAVDPVSGVASADASQGRKSPWGG